MHFYKLIFNKNSMSLQFAILTNFTFLFFKIQSDNQIYVSGLPMNLNEEDIAQYFGSIGVIKNDKRTGKVCCKMWD